VAVASAGPYANLHLPQTDKHAKTQSRLLELYFSQKRTTTILKGFYYTGFHKSEILMDERILMVNV